jgi:hypothetical protein
MPGASELPSFVAVEITKDVRSLPVLVPKGKPAAVDGAPRRRCRLASKSPIVAPAVRAATMLAQYQGFDTSPRDDRRDTKNGQKRANILYGLPVSRSWEGPGVRWLYQIGGLTRWSQFCNSQNFLTKYFRGTTFAPIESL